MLEGTVTPDWNVIWRETPVTLITKTTMNKYYLNLKYFSSQTPNYKTLAWHNTNVPFHLTGLHVTLYYPVCYLTMYFPVWRHIRYTWRFCIGMSLKLISLPIAITPNRLRIFKVMSTGGGSVDHLSVPFVINILVT